MKKILLYLLMMIMLLTSFAGCMGTDKNKDSSSTSSKNDSSNIISSITEKSFNFD